MRDGRFATPRFNDAWMSPVCSDAPGASCSEKKCRAKAGFFLKNQTRSSLLRARRERPCDSRAAEKRDEVAPFHCPISPVLPTERIAYPQLQ